MRPFSWIRGAFELTKWFILAGFILLLIHTFVVTLFIVSGPSMEKTLFNRDLTLVNRIVYTFGQPKRGDVVVVRFPGDPEKTYYVKRVIGLPGEKLEIKGGQVYINGQKLSEPYLGKETTTPDGSWQIPAGTYFTMGDFRSVSSDSRDWGTADKSFMLGRVEAVLLPQPQVLTAPLY